MPNVHPFRAWRARADIAHAVASVPYDVVDRAEAKQLANENALSFLRVTKPEITLNEQVEATDSKVYQQGQKHLKEMISEGYLEQDCEASFYVYELTMGTLTQTGIGFCADVADYAQNNIRKHEFTRPAKENDRVQHIESCQAQTGVVFLVHRDVESLQGVIDRIKNNTTAIDFKAVDGIRHRLWRSHDPDLCQEIQNAFAQMDALYIADGHHRCAAANRVARKNSRSSYQRFLAVSFPTSQVSILPYNRVVKDLGKLQTKTFLEAVCERFNVKEEIITQPAPHHFAMYLAGQWYTLDATPYYAQAQNAVAKLDVSILQDYLLAPILNIQDPRNDERIDFIGGIRGSTELEKRVQQGFAVAFSLYPTQIEDMLAVADAGAIMPPKSTWFEPKLRDGLIVHIYE